LLLFALISLFAILGPFLSGYDYAEMHLTAKNAPPSWLHWFGTDDLGRDIFTRTSIGARISLAVGLTAALIDMVIGILWGSAAALSNRLVDGIMMRMADILFALPYLLIVILITVVMGPGLTSIIFSMSVMGWISMARIVRGQVLQIKEMDYVLASRALGGSFWHILRLHILPHAKGPILATLAMTIPQAIFTEAFLSFLGLGIPPPLSSWGTMSNEALPALAYYPWRLFFPALFICMTMFSLNLISEGLSDE
jgi:oligopeptide transport system permease protein